MYSQYFVTFLFAGYHESMKRNTADEHFRLDIDEINKTYEKIYN